MEWYLKASFQNNFQMSIYMITYRISSECFVSIMIFTLNAVYLHRMRSKSDSITAKAIDVCFCYLALA